MSLCSKLTKISLGLVIALCCAAGAFAQQPAGQQDSAPGRMQRERGARRGGPGEGRGHQMGGMMRALRELDLTEAQQQQARAIIERAAESTKPQREALRQLHEQFEQGAPSSEANAERAKQLSGEIREAMQKAHTEILSLLTPEQRAKLEQMKQERKARHEERRERRREQQDNEQ
ncbi:MAG TPA: Spy/CpxP family protein refolding chaperone [Pyrinomonadaceae bacterium]|jgi:Spy/CpxP family protein refolding chaperone